MITAHLSSVIDRGAVIGEGTRISPFCHIRDGAKIGRDCTICECVFVDNGATIGDRCKIKNNVAVFARVTIEDDVFLGPSCVFTNVINPRAAVPRAHEFKPTLVRQGATIGANATIVCGHTIGRFAFVGAGAVVTRDVPDFALVVGCPARQIGWMNREGIKVAECPE